MPCVLVVVVALVFTVINLLTKGIIGAALPWAAAAVLCGILWGTTRRHGRG